MKTQRIKQKLIREQRKLLHFAACEALLQGQVAGAALDLAAGAALSQGTVQISRQAQHFRRVRWGFCGRRSTFARLGTDFVAGAAPSQGTAQTLRQVQHFCKVRYRFSGRRSVFARSGTELVAGAALSQGQVQISRQVHHFRKVRCRFCGRRSTFASDEEKDRPSASRPSLLQRGPAWDATRMK